VIWDRPHPSNADIAPKVNELLATGKIDEANSALLLVEAAIADRLAGIEDLLGAQMSAEGEAGDREFAKRVAREAHRALPGRTSPPTTPTERSSDAAPR
jgi:hypothetical protein